MPGVARVVRRLRADNHVRHNEMRIKQTAAGGLLRPSVAAAGAATLVALGWSLDAARRERQSSRMHRTLVDLLLNALHSGDPWTARHSRRVADLTDVLGCTYDLDQEARARLRLAALLHDLGKMDDQIFEITHSNGGLSPRDRRAMQQHPRGSAHILRPLDEIHPGIAAVVAAHHESWDGSGYPRGLSGNRIPLEARIVSAADVFDALTQPRPYRDPISVGAALERIRKGAGKKFDPEVVKRVMRADVKARWEEIARDGRAAERRAAEKQGARQPVATG